MKLADYYSVELPKKLNEEELLATLDVHLVCPS